MSTTLWNVAVPVVDLIEADTAETALATLRARLIAAGFDPYAGELSSPGGDAFESEAVSP